MNKKLPLLSIFILLCVGTNLFAQTLLYEASGNGTTFSKTGGTQNYTLTLGGNSVEDGKLIISAGNMAPNIAVSPGISAYSGGGVTILLKVSHVDVTKGGQLLTIGNSDLNNIGGLKIKTGRTDGLLHATWRSAEWSGGAMTTTFPTDSSIAVVGYAYLRENEDAGQGKGSEFYLNGRLAHTFTGLQASDEDIDHIAFGGLSKENSLFLNEGMQVHAIRLYAGRLSSEQVSRLTSDLAGLTYDAELASDGNGTVSIQEADGDDIMFGVSAFTSLTIVATPSEGYIFDKWVDANDETKVISVLSPYTFNISSDISYKALFLPHTEKVITVTTDGHGTTDKTGTNNVVLSDVFTVNATANLGYVFDKWVNANNAEEVLSTANPFVYLGRENLNLKALFKIGVVSSTVAPTADDGQWYFVQSQRSATTGQAWWTLADPVVEGEAVHVVTGALTKADNQKFTLVTTAEGHVTFKSYDGRIMINTGAFVANATLPTEGWVLTPNTVAGINGFLFPGENLGLHQGNAGWAWQVRTGHYSVTDNCTFFFHQESSQATLRELYNTIFNIYNLAYVSPHPGNYSSQEDKTALKTALEEAATKFNSNDESEIIAAIAALRTAQSTFVAKENELIRSTANAPVWYRIKNMGPAHSNGKVIVAQENGMQPKWGDATPITDDKLFRFEAHPTDSVLVIIISAAYPEGQLNGVISETTRDTPYYFRLGKVFGDEGVKYRLFAASMSSGQRQLHAEPSTNNIIFRNGNYSSASMWQFERFYVNDKLKSIIEIAENYLNGTIVEGSAGNHKNKADVDALKTAIATAKTYVESEDVAQLAVAETALQAAINTFVAAANKIETSTASDPIYYLLINGMEDGYATGKALYTVNETGALQWQDVEPLNENKFFFFQAHATNANQYAIINAAYPNGGLQDYRYGSASIYFDFEIHRGKQGAKFQIYDGQLDVSVARQLHADEAQNLVYRNNDRYTGASMWKLMKLAEYLDNRYQELVNEVAKWVDSSYNPIGFQLGIADGNYGQAQFDTMVNAYKAMVADKNNGGNTLYTTISELSAAIVDFRASQVITTSIDATTTSNIKVTIVDRSIVAVGTDAPVQVYTITGARVQNNNLTDGIYVARVAGKTFKVLVK